MPLCAQTEPVDLRREEVVQDEHDRFRTALQVEFLQQRIDQIFFLLAKVCGRRTVRGDPANRENQSLASGIDRSISTNSRETIRDDDRIVTGYTYNSERSLRR